MEFHRRPLGLQALAAIVIALATSCGSASSVPSPISSQAQTAKVRDALATYNRAFQPASANVERYCGSDLPRCQAALGDELSADRGLDDSLRQIGFSGPASSAAAAVLSADASVEDILDRARKEPTLDRVNSHYQEYTTAIAGSVGALNTLRRDLGVEAAPTSPPVPATDTPFSVSTPKPAS